MASILARFHYGWVIVISSTLATTVISGTAYSFGVFFKPIIADFGWSRALLSGAYSLYLIVGGILSAPAGWLADRYGPGKVSACCGAMMGLGLVLASRATEIWHFYLAFGLVSGIGGSGAFSVGMGIAARWFVKKRSLALGIVAAGFGIGALLFPPVVERLIAAHGWAGAFLDLGVVSGVLMIAGSLVLKRDPQSAGVYPYGMERAAPPAPAARKRHRETAGVAGVSLREALRARSLWTMLFIVLTFNVSVQVVMVHAVNYATDKGITPFIAAAVISVIGVFSTAGRVVMGVAADRIGNHIALVLCCFVMPLSLIWLLFSGQAWMLFVFAPFFGFVYGGEVPQMPGLVGRYFGLASVSTIVGLIMLAMRLGGATGSLLGGIMFDKTGSYTGAFLLAIISGFLTLAAAYLLMRTRREATAAFPPNSMHKSGNAA